jgi:hypothetical protein
MTPTPKDIIDAERKLADQLRKVRAAKKGLPVDGSVVATQADLSRHYKVERSTIHTWIQKGMPGEPGRYVIADIDEWRKSQHDDEALLSSPLTSPWLEELRKNKALQEEIKLNLMRGSVVEVDRVRDCLAVWSATIRRLGDQLTRNFGREAEVMVADALDDCRRAVGSIFSESHGNDNGDISEPARGVDDPADPPKKPTRSRARKRQVAQPAADQPVGGGQPDSPQRPAQRQKVQAPSTSSQPIVVRGFGFGQLE